MEKLKILIGVSIVLLITGCSYLQREPERNQNQVIKYVNLKYIYEFMIKKNSDARELAAQKENVAKTIVQLKTKFDKSPDKKGNLSIKLKRQRYIYNVILKREKKYKSTISNKINQALKNVAKESDVDFILNIGDEVIYGKRKYDMTEDVIRELIRINKLSAPVSR